MFTHLPLHSFYGLECSRCIKTCYTYTYMYYPLLYVHVTIDTDLFMTTDGLLACRWRMPLCLQRHTTIKHAPWEMIISLSLQSFINDWLIYLMIWYYILKMRERERAWETEIIRVIQNVFETWNFFHCFSPKNRLWGFGWDVDSPMKGLTCWKGIKSCSFIVFPILGRTCPILG